MEGETDVRKAVLVLAKRLAAVCDLPTLRTCRTLGAQRDSLVIAREMHLLATGGEESQYSYELSVRMVRTAFVIADREKNRAEKLRQFEACRLLAENPRGFNPAAAYNRLARMAEDMGRLEEQVEFEIKSLRTLVDPELRKQVEEEIQHAREILSKRDSAVRIEDKKHERPASLVREIKDWVRGVCPSWVYASVDASKEE